MAIAKMNRFSLLTFHTHRASLLKRLQVFGDVHFKSLDQKELSEADFLHSAFSPDELNRYEAELEKVRFSVQKLAPHAEKAGKRPTLTFEEFDRYTAQYDYDAVYEQVRTQDEAITNYRAEIARRTAENESLAAWRSLDVSPQDLSALEQATYLLGTVNKQTAEEFAGKVGEKFDNVYVELLDTVKEDTSLLALLPAEQLEEVFAYMRELGFTRSSLQLKGRPTAVMEENLKEIEALNGRIDKAVSALAALSPEHPKLLIALDYFESLLERERATQNFAASETVLLIEGWVPVDESEKLQGILREVCGDEYYLDLQAEERDSETVPIKLKNNAFVTTFESITSMYSMPHYNEIDPTPILAPFYWVFFGMMVGDMGYGIVLFLGTTIALKVLDLKEGMQDFMRFFRYLSIAVFLAGALYGSLFGVSVLKPINHPIYGPKPILDSQLDITTMLIVSIVIGLVHITVGLLTKTYMGIRDGDYASGLFDGLLWLITILSGIAWLLSAVIDLGGAGNICKWVFILCLIGLAATQGRQSPSIGGKIGNGLYGVYGITSYVGDIVSYTRIVALGLSSAYIAYAFNLMMQLVVGDFSGNLAVSIIRLIFGIVIVLLGQALNLGLALLGGYVHSCRLQYVEFFSKFYDGGGVPFRPLGFKNQHIKINK